MARFAFELGDKLEQYDTILSDDASARLVSLFLRKLVNYKREKTDKPPVKTYFIQGGRHNSRAIRGEVEKFLKE